MAKRKQIRTLKELQAALQGLISVGYHPGATAEASEHQYRAVTAATDRSFKFFSGKIEAQPWDGGDPIALNESGDTPLDAFVATARALTAEIERRARKRQLGHTPRDVKDVTPLAPRRLEDKRGVPI